LAGLLDRQFLLGDLPAESVDARLRPCDIGARLVERGLVIAGVDPRKDLAGVDRLIVVDWHLRDIARHLGADQDRMRLHISVVGRHHETTGGPPIVARDPSAGEEHYGRGTGQQAL
jgi:hypothetical protein